MSQLPDPSTSVAPSLSRRSALKGAAACAFTGAMARASTLLANAPQPPRVLAYVGSYSSAMDGGAGNGKGIYLFEMHPETGVLTLISLAAEARNPSWLCLDPSGRYLYSVNEIADFQGNNGSVSAYSVHRPTGELSLLNVTSSAGAGPAHLSVDLEGRYVFVANYIGGTIAVLPILATGALGPAVYTHQDTGSVGSKTAQDAPPDSFAISGHDKPHAHMIHAAPGNRFVLQTDLGQDRLYVYRLDAAAGKLIPAAGTPFITFPSGDGPRHFLFHANGRWLYCLQEEASTIVFLHFDAVTGAIHAMQTISTLPPGFRGTSFTSELALSADGRFLYAANRLHDTIAFFSIQSDGRLAYIGETSVLGDYPRHIAVSPNGKFLYACNQRSDAITSFRIDPGTGRLAFTGDYAGIGSPACITFLT